MGGLLVVISGLVAASTGSPPATPIRAQVIVAQANVRCGPGDRYYVTQSLAKGRRIQIYDRTDDGWLAIRPPRESFSLIAAKHVTMTDRSGLGRISGDDAVSWIGSQLPGRRDHKWMVRLQRNEVVEVLGERRQALLADAEPSHVYRISPPAGEFRWIHAGDTDYATGPTPGVAGRAPGGRNEAGSSRGSSRLPTGMTVMDIPLANFEIRAQSAGAAAGRGARRSELGTASGWTPSPQRRNDGEAAALGGTPAARPPSPPLPYNEGELGAINLALTQMVSLSADQWNLDPLRSRTLRFIERQREPVTRGRARLLLERIDEFAELSRRHQRLQRAAVPHPVTDNRVPHPVTALQRLVSGNPPPAGGGNLGVSVDTTDYDGVGWLVPVHSRSRTAPPFALMDQDGNLIKLVSASPGLNLHRYARKHVGIIGQRGVALDRPHVTAERVVDLDRHLNLPPAAADSEAVALLRSVLGWR